MRIREKRIVFVLPSLGHFNDLLYWEKILSGFVEKFMNSSFLTLHTENLIGDTGYRVEKIISSDIFFKKIIIGPLLFLKILAKKPDLLVLFEFSELTFYGFLIRIFFKKTKILLVVENDPKYLGRFNKNRKTKLISCIRRFVAKRSNLMLTNNSLGCQYLRRELKIDRKKILVGPYLTSSFFDASLPPKKLNCNDRLILLAVGRLIPLKGTSLIFKALSELKPPYREKVRLEIVGNGPEKKNLEEMVKKFRLRNNVRFCGAVSYRKLATYFKNAHVLVFPTLGDYRGLAGFEALSLGLPIIGSVFDGASSETIEDGLNGFVIDPTKTSELANKIMFFLKRKKKITEFSRRSLTMGKKFTVEKAVGNLVRACEKSLKE